MAYWEIIFFWIAMIAYALTGGGFIYSFVFKNPRVVTKVTALVAFGRVPGPDGSHLLTVPRHGAPALVRPL